jgi:O-glycosyl hydrolase
MPVQSQRLRQIRLERAVLLALLVVTLAGCVPGGPSVAVAPVERAIAAAPVAPRASAVHPSWQETRFAAGCDPGPFSDPPPVDDSIVDSTLAPDSAEAERMALSVNLASATSRGPLLGAGFNFEHGLWSCPAFHHVLQQDLLEPFHPSLARVDTGLLPAAPPDLPVTRLNREVYQSVLASEAYAGQWQMIRKLDHAGARVVLGVWGGPDQFTDDGTRRGVLLASHYDDYVEYVVSVVDFLVGQQHLPIWAITIANEPDGGDGNQIPPDGLAYIAHQLALRLEPYGVELYGPDTTSADAALDYLPMLLADQVVSRHLAFVGFHQYSGDPEVASVTNFVHARRPDLPVVVTEYTSFNFGDLDAGQEAVSPLDFTLEVADTVLAHYRYGADAALYWDAADYLQPGHDAITHWGLLRGPTEDFGKREWYYGLLQILPYLQPGAQVLQTERHGGEDLGLLAVRTADGQLALFLVNQQSRPIDLDLDVIGGPETTPSLLSVTRTDATDTLLGDGVVMVDQGAARVTVPARSIVTLLGS